MNRQENQTQLIKTARVAGIWYLMMAISGVLGFMVFHPQVFDTDPSKTLENLTNQGSLARIRILLEFAIIVSQALTAAWFYKLFRSINPWAAWSTGIWGMTNAIIILISAIAMSTALGMAAGTFSTDDKVMVIDLMSKVSSNAWGTGTLFFGLWLIPLGYIVTSSRRMPIWLGRTLIAGGIGYLLNALINYSGLDFSYSVLLTIPASVGEFWMIGYLLIFGIRPEKD